MPLTIKTQFESAVSESNLDIFTRSYQEDGVTILEFDTRKRNYKKQLDIRSKIKWGNEYTVDIKELSTLYCQLSYRFILSQGSYYDRSGKRKFFTPRIGEVSMSQHVSKSVVRLSSYLAVNCGISLRHISILLTHLFLIPISKSSIKRWIDDIGNNLPSDEELLRRMIALKAPTECHIDGYYPMGTDHCVMVAKDEYGRILMTHEADSENKDEAIKFLTTLKRLGVNVVSGFSDYSKSFTEALKQVYPNAKLQADHFHTMKNIWKHLKKSFLAFRREVKDDVNNYKAKWKQERIEKLAEKLWVLRWTILKKPDHLTEEEKEQLKSLEQEDCYDFVGHFRSIIGSIVSLFDASETELSAKLKLGHLRHKVNALDNSHYNRIIKFLEDHWSEATHYLKKEGPEKRSSNSESGMRLLRRLEKNHDGIRSETTRKNYIKIYQVITYLKNSDVADFIENSLPDI